MSTAAAPRSRVRSAAVPVLLVATVAYFAYHAANGERGLLAWWQLRQDIRAAEAIHADLTAERQRLEHRAALLYRDRLHPDMLDERARTMLNLIGPDEVLVLPHSE